jgi:hypothetical protein
MNTSIKVGFFLGQAIILLSLPYEIFAFLSALPSWVEAQANEMLIISLGTYIPFVLLCETAAWVAFRSKQARSMLVATMAPIIVLVILVLSGYLF